MKANDIAEFETFGGFAEKILFNFFEKKIKEIPTYTFAND